MPTGRMTAMSQEQDTLFSIRLCTWHHVDRRDKLISRPQIDPKTILLHLHLTVWLNLQPSRPKYDSRFQRTSLYVLSVTLSRNLSPTANIAPAMRVTGTLPVLLLPYLSFLECEDACRDENPSLCPMERVWAFVPSTAPDVQFHPGSRMIC